MRGWKNVECPIVETVQDLRVTRADAGGNQVPERTPAVAGRSEVENIAQKRGEEPKVPDACHNTGHGQQAVEGHQFRLRHARTRPPKAAHEQV